MWGRGQAQGAGPRGAWCAPGASFPPALRRPAGAHLGQEGVHVAGLEAQLGVGHGVGGIAPLLHCLKVLLGDVSLRQVEPVDECQDVPGRERGGCPGWGRPGGPPGGGAGREGHSLFEALVVALGGAEADDGVDHGGRVHGREAVDDRHDQCVHLAVVAADEGSWVTAGRRLSVRSPGPGLRCWVRRGRGLGPPIRLSPTGPGRGPPGGRPQVPWPLLLPFVPPHVPPVLQPGAGEAPRSLEQPWPPALRWATPVRTFLLAGSGSGPSEHVLGETASSRRDGQGLMALGPLPAHAPPLGPCVLPEEGSPPPPGT